MKSYEPPTKEFFRLPNKIFQVPLDATQFKLYSYFICCSGSKGYCWPTMDTIIRETGIKLPWRHSRNGTPLAPLGLS